MMLAANRIAPNVMVARPELMSEVLSKIPLGASEEWLRSHGASEAEEAQEMLDWVEQMARHLVAMRLVNSHDTTTHEEQPA